MEKIKKILFDIIEKLYEIKVDLNFVVAPKETGADFATNVAMLLAKSQKKNPFEIATGICEELSKHEEIEEAEVAKPGFINIRLADSFYRNELNSYEKDFLKNISSGEYSNKIVICEFSDPNPFKILHVGHLYTSIVGDSISRLVEFAGGKVVRANFGGDVGLHVAKNMYALVKKINQIEKEMSPIEKAELMAETYVEGASAYEEDEEARQKIIEINKKIYRIAEAGEGVIRELEELIRKKDAEEDAKNREWSEGYNIEDGEQDEGGGIKKRELLEEEEELRLARVYFWGREASYQYFEDFYNQIGVRFDRYYPESTVMRKGLGIIEEQLGEGVYERSNGAVIFKGEDYGLHTRVFINKNGLPTYEAKDIGLIFTKWEDYHFDKSIIITGNDIVEYMKVVLKSVEQYAPKLSERTLHITHGQVKLPGREKMSSRKGNFLKAVDVIEMIGAELRQGRKNESIDREAGEIEVDEKILLGAIRYAFLKYKVGGDIVFDVKGSVSMTGNSGPYLQYAAVRAQRVLGKIIEGQANLAEESSKVKTDVENLAEREETKRIKKVIQNEWILSEYEKNLIKKIIQYREVVSEAVAELAPSKICTYLYEIAQEFSRFYENVQVAGSEFEVERGKIVLAYLKVLTHGLDLLGIKIPEKM